MRLWKHVVTCSGGQKQHGTGLFDTHTNLYSVDYTANSIKNLKLWPSISSVFPQNSSEAQRKKKITCWPDWLNYFPFLEIFSVWGQRVASPDFLKESVVRKLQNLIKTWSLINFILSSYYDFVPCQPGCQSDSLFNFMKQGLDLIYVTYQLMVDTDGQTVWESTGPTYYPLRAESWQQIYRIYFQSWLALCRKSLNNYSFLLIKGKSKNNKRTI